MGRRVKGCNNGDCRIQAHYNVWAAANAFYDSRWNNRNPDLAYMYVIKMLTVVSHHYGTHRA